MTEQPNALEQMTLSKALAFIDRLEDTGWTARAAKLAAEEVRRLHADLFLHPTGRHPEGGCDCIGDPGDPPCEFHAPANGVDELDVTPVAVPADIDISVRKNMLLIERYKSEVRQLRDQLIVRDMQVSTLKELRDQAEAKSDELRRRWDRAQTEVERLSAESTSDEKPGKARIEADGGEVDEALDAVEYGDEIDRHKAAILAAEIHRQRRAVVKPKPVTDGEMVDAIVVLSGAIQNQTQRAAWETFSAKARELREESTRRTAAADAWIEKACDLAREEAHALRIKVARLRADNERLTAQLEEQRVMRVAAESAASKFSSKLARTEALLKKDTNLLKREEVLAALGDGVSDV